MSAPYTPKAFEDVADALPKLRGHMSDCGCSRCTQMSTVASMLRQGAGALERENWLNRDRDGLEAALESERQKTKQYGAALLALFDRESGPWHDEDCPCDDTCDCSAKSIHDAVNSAHNDIAHALQPSGEV